MNLASREPYGSANLRRITARDWTPSDVVYSLGGTNGSAFVVNFASNQGGSTPPALGWYDLNVLAVVGGWFAGSNANYGFALRSGAEGWGGTRRNFASSRDPLGRGPELVIDYDAPPNLDSDGDGLPDEWERDQLGQLATRLSRGGEGRDPAEEVQELEDRIGDVERAVRLPVDELQVRGIRGAPVAAGKCLRASQEQESGT